VLKVPSLTLCLIHKPFRYHRKELLISALLVTLNTITSPCNERTILWPDAILHWKCQWGSQFGTHFMPSSKLLHVTFSCTDRQATTTQGQSRDSVCGIVVCVADSDSRDAVVLGQDGASCQTLGNSCLTTLSAGSGLRVE
jgi:hypothetical protein